MNKETAPARVLDNLTTVLVVWVFSKMHCKLLAAAQSTRGACYDADFGLHTGDTDLEGQGS